MIRVFVVTYRRPHLLERALSSLVAQDRTDWNAEVLNDDPADGRVAEVIARIGDPRIELSRPPQRRGGTGNFNYAFRTAREPLASILEDDNWWNRDFLSVMTGALDRNPGFELACGNERIWQEQADGNWKDTGQLIWPETSGERPFGYDLADKCGAAKLCNSSLLFRTRASAAWQTPASVPIDVTEHFRERVVPHPFLLVHPPCVNYAETLRTHRSPDRAVWAEYQSLLIASVFAGLAPGRRPALAEALWRRARTVDRLYKTSLLSTGLFFAGARCLWRMGRPGERARILAGLVRRPRIAWRLLTARRRRADAWEFLRRGPFVDHLKGLG